MILKKCQEKRLLSLDNVCHQQYKLKVWCSSATLRAPWYFCDNAESRAKKLSSNFDCQASSSFLSLDLKTLCSFNTKILLFLSLQFCWWFLCKRRLAHCFSSSPIWQWTCLPSVFHTSFKYINILITNIQERKKWSTQNRWSATQCAWPS